MCVNPRHLRVRVIVAAPRERIGVDWERLSRTLRARLERYAADLRATAGDVHRGVVQVPVPEVHEDPTGVLDLGGVVT